MLRGPFLHLRQLKVMLRDLEKTLSHVGSLRFFSEFEVFRRAISIPLRLQSPG